MTSSNLTMHGSHMDVSIPLIPHYTVFLTQLLLKQVSPNAWCTPVPESEGKVSERKLGWRVVTVITLINCSYNNPLLKFLQTHMTT